jgi:hypothetical protein
MSLVIENARSPLPKPPKRAAQQRQPCIGLYLLMKRAYALMGSPMADAEDSEAELENKPATA